MHLYRAQVGENGAADHLVCSGAYHPMRMATIVRDVVVFSSSSGLDLPLLRQWRQEHWEFLDTAAPPHHVVKIASRLAEFAVVTAYRLG